MGIIVAIIMVYTCICGITLKKYSKYNIDRHNETKKHKKHIGIEMDEEGIWLNKRPNKEIPLIDYLKQLVKKYEPAVEEQIEEVVPDVVVPEVIVPDVVVPEVIVPEVIVPDVVVPEVVVPEVIVPDVVVDEKKEEQKFYKSPRSQDRLECFERNKYWINDPNLRKGKGCHLRKSIIWFLNVFSRSNFTDEEHEYQSIGKFGSGYWSEKHIESFPPDIQKILIEDCAVCYGLFDY